MTPALPCTRCGTFLPDPQSGRLIANRLFCATCAARPDVDYLEAIRLKYWGKRDGWAWLVGVGVPGQLAGIVGAVSGENWLLAAVQAPVVIASVGFFLGLRWARWGLMSLGLPTLALAAVSEESSARVVFAVVSLMPVVIVAMIIQSTPNRLFFKLEVSRAELQKLWHLTSDNSIARQGFMLGLLSLLVWPLGVVGLVLSIIGITKVNPKAHPPIGRFGQALAGIICSSLGIVACIVAVATGVWGEP